MARIEGDRRGACPEVEWLPRACEADEEGAFVVSARERENSVPVAHQRCQVVESQPAFCRMSEYDPVLAEAPIERSIRKQLGQLHLLGCRRSTYDQMIVWKHDQGALTIRNAVPETVTSPSLSEGPIASSIRVQAHDDNVQDRIGVVAEAIGRDDDLLSLDRETGGAPWYQVVLLRARAKNWRSQALPPFAAAAAEQS